MRWIDVRLERDLEDEFSLGRVFTYVSFVLKSNQDVPLRSDRDRKGSVNDWPLNSDPVFVYNVYESVAEVNDVQHVTTWTRNHVVDAAETGNGYASLERPRGDVVDFEILSHCSADVEFIVEFGSTPYTVGSWQRGVQSSCLYGNVTDIILTVTCTLPHTNFAQQQHNIIRALLS